MSIALVQRGRYLAQLGLWIALNLLDLGLSLTGRHVGAVEVGLIVRLIGTSYWGFIIYKVVMIAAVLAFLAQLQKMHLLRWLNVGMGCVCLWNTGVILWSGLLWAL